MPGPWKRDPSWFRPGQVAPGSGLYRVYHYAHRMPHEVIVMQNTVFPDCKGCGDLVQFAPLIAGQLIEDDSDFSNELEATA